MTHRLDRAAHALGDVSRSVAEVSEKLAQTEAADVRSVYEKISGQAAGPRDVSVLLGKGTGKHHERFSGIDAGSSKRRHCI